MNKFVYKAVDAILALKVPLNMYMPFKAQKMLMHVLCIMQLSVFTL